MLDTIAPYSRYIELYLIHKFILRRGDYLIPTMQTSRPFAALVLLLAIGNCAVREHLMNKPVPGYGAFEPDIYSGYLNTSSKDRKLHYVFVESAKKANNSDPVTLWLNGGPGCSSLLGFLQQIGPYFLEEGKNYSVGDSLTENPYSWHKISNLLFLESPAGVGYSYNDGSEFEYSDATTLEDNLQALLSFYQNYPEYAKNGLWLSGESYAGKYIPDLAVAIDYYNQQDKSTPINLLGLLVGNGIMSFEQGQLQKSSVQYMIDHEFIDPELINYYMSSCRIDPLSAGCRYFAARFAENVEEINPYNVYSYCFYNESQQDQASIIRQISRSSLYEPEQLLQGINPTKLGANGAPCSYFEGLRSYFNLNSAAYHGRPGASWNGPCADNITAKYQISLRGSMAEYRYLLGRVNNYQILLYNGDWDDVVPFKDTLKNIAKLNLVSSNVYTSFFAEDQHAGWLQQFSGLRFAIVKGASHMVPQSKRPAAWELFKTLVTSSRDTLRQA